VAPVIKILLTHLTGNRYQSDVLDERGRRIVLNDFDLDPQEYEKYEQHIEYDAFYKDSQDKKMIGRCGEFLHKCLFGNGADNIRTELQRPEYQNGVTFEIHLPIDCPKLWQVPWEFAWDGSRQMPYALRPRYTFRRIPRGLSRTAPPVPQGHMRVLLAISNPIDLEDRGLQELDTEAEINAINYACEKAVRDGRIQLKLLEECNLTSLRRLVCQFDPHVIQITSHGETMNGIPYLLLEDGDGGSKLATANDLWSAIGYSESLRLVFLPGCLTGQVPPTDVFSGLATGLLREREMAVVSIQYPISDRAGNRLAEELYGRLAEGATVEDAVAQARQVLRNVGGIERAAWGIVAFYTRFEGGCKLIDLNKPCFKPNPEAGPYTPLPVEPAYVKPNEPYRKLKAEIRGKAPFVFLTGEDGIGKTALVAKVLERLHEEKEIDDSMVFRSWSQNNPADGFLKDLVMFLEEQNAPEKLLRLLMSDRSITNKVRAWAQFVQREAKAYVFVFEDFEFLLKQGNVLCDISDEQMEEWLVEIKNQNWGRTKFIFISSFPCSLFSGGLGGRVASIVVPELTKGQALLLMEREKMGRTRGASEEVKRQAFDIVGGHPLLLWLFNSYLENTNIDIQQLIANPEFREQLEKEKHLYLIKQVIQRLTPKERKLLETLSVLGEASQEELEGHGFSGREIQRLVNLRLIEQLPGSRGFRFEAKPYNESQEEA